MGIVYVGNRSRIPPYRFLENVGGAAFSPLDVAGLQLWLVSSLGVYQEHDSKTTPSGNGDPVGTWEDQSGNGNDVNAPASDIQRPILVTGVVNGLPILRFDGGQYLRKAFALNQPYTVYIIFLQDSWTNNDRVFTGVTNQTIFIQNGISPTLKLYAGSFVADNTDLPLDTFGICRVIFNGASSSIRIDDNVATTGNPGALSAGGITIGASTTGANDSDIDVAEVFIYNAAISGEDDTNIMTYLNDKYNIY